MVVLQRPAAGRALGNNERVTLERALGDREPAELGAREQLAIDLRDGVSQQLVDVRWLLSTEAQGAARGGRSK